MIQKDKERLSAMTKKRNELIIKLMDEGEKAAFIGYVMNISRQAIERIYLREKGKQNGL